MRPNIDRRARPAIGARYDLATEIERGEREEDADMRRDLGNVTDPWWLIFTMLAVIGLVLGTGCLRG